MSVRVYYIRNRKDPRLFYRKGSVIHPRGWVDTFLKASLWSSSQGANRSLNHTEGLGELMYIDGIINDNERLIKYLCRNRITGEYIAKKSMRKRRKMFTKKIMDAEMFPGPLSPSKLISSYNEFYKYLNDDRKLSISDFDVIPCTILIPRYREDFSC